MTAKKAKKQLSTNEVIKMVTSLMNHESKMKYCFTNPSKKKIETIENELRYKGFKIERKENEDRTILHISH